MSTPQLQAQKEAKTTEISGTKWLGLLKTYYHDGSLARMCQALLQCQWSQKKSSDLKAFDTKPFHILFQPQLSTPSIDECDGLCTTPNTMDHLPLFRGRNNEVDGGSTQRTNKTGELEEQVTTRQWICTNRHLRLCYDTNDTGDRALLAELQLNNRRLSKDGKRGPQSEPSRQKMWRTPTASNATQTEERTTLPQSQEGRLKRDNISGRSKDVSTLRARD